jgi:hypothetical protein
MMMIKRSTARLRLSALAIRIAAVAALLCVHSSFAQISILGKDSRDKVLSGFFSQNNNVAVIILGLNANFGTNRLNSDMIENAIRGNSGARILDGVFGGTNSLELRIWDTNLNAFAYYDFQTRTNLPVTTNTVSRVGLVEQLLFKTLNNFRFASNGVALTGIIKSDGNSYGEAILGKSGTNRILVLDNYALGLNTTNYVQVREGVVEEWK